MEALDLSLRPPRPPREELAGVIFLPRSIDKVRASLPGGNLGLYAIAGFTQMMLDALGISLDSFTFAVKGASSDEDVAAFVRRNTMAQERTKWNAFIEAREPRGGNRAEAIQSIPGSPIAPISFSHSTCSPKTTGRLSFKARFAGLGCVWTSAGRGKAAQWTSEKRAANAFPSTSKRASNRLPTSIAARRKASRSRSAGSSR